MRKLSDILAYFLLFLILIPIFYVMFFITQPIKDNTAVLFDSYLVEYFKNTGIILFFTLLFSTIIAIFLAYFESFYEYRFRNFFRFVLVLPFAIPSYLFAYIYADFFSYFSWFNIFLREQFNLRIHFDIMNIYGAIFVFSLAFFPYVYILLRGFLAKFSANIINSAKSLGKSDTAIFFQIILPLSRPAIVAGASLCAMETLNAYGAPNYYGLHVFSTGIYKAWIAYNDLNAAIKLAVILLFVVFFILLVEKIFRRPYEISSKTYPIKRKKLSKIASFIIIVLFSFIFFFSFLLPVIHILIWFKRSFLDVNYSALFILSKNTFFLSLSSSLIILIIATFLAFNQRFKKGRAKIIISSLSNMGYSIPGSVIAICMLALFICIDRINEPIYNFFGINNALFLTLSPVLLIFAYVVRFLALGFNGLDAAFNKLPSSITYARLSLGKNPFSSFFKIEFILVLPSLISSFILIFIEILKELPLASLLATSNFKTLSFEMDRYASDEQLAMLSAPALVLVLTCFILLVIFNLIKERK
ncbi:ABC transporter permease [Campylobacter canadensis]|uniref:ABC transporter permease n=1 Tax=Campylobacter canadensis TaxID=449520 RepID=UPI001CCFDCE7|nr:iron ABC transporter permease [Campylobacter canadensis]